MSTRMAHPFRFVLILALIFTSAIASPAWALSETGEDPISSPVIQSDFPEEVDVLANSASKLAPNIAYILRGDKASADSFSNLLTPAGYGFDLVPLGNVLATDFANYDLIIIADDTGNLSQWGIPGSTAAQVAQITKPNKPIIGLGEGGYAFFGQLSLFIGWPNGWHGPQSQMLKAPTAPSAYYGGIAADPVPVYSRPVNSVGIYLGKPPLPSNVIPVGLEVPSEDHASLIQQDCRLLWGASGNADLMTGDGQTLFLNSIRYMIGYQCGERPPAPETCLKIEKTAEPAPGTPVTPGQVIKYTVSYIFSNNPQCENPRVAKLVDSVPLDTVFVPGSASDGISPGADGALVWSVSAAAGVQTKTFKVLVSDNQCVHQRTVNNRAGLIVGGFAPLISNVVSHPVDCPPIRLPNNEPMFAQDEISIDPYPLIVGRPSTIRVRVSNAGDTPQTVQVAFQTSPNRFGIGLDFSSFDTRMVTIPGHGNVIVEGVFVPASSGHYCIQIVITGPGLNQPLITQRNIDVTETLEPGVPDTLTFKVRNNTATTADITLVVDNTCPGWSAAIVDPPGGILMGMAPGEIRDAKLQVTPPNPVVLGSGCHIDVQGWIGDHLIGGIRKLDVPPVQLPTDVNPPWAEKEISVTPDPPVVGKPAAICVELQNPLPFARTVTVEFAVADFGAGVPFTPVATANFVLPPNSIQKYCVNWTPAPGGTLHRCILATLKQAGYADMRSQRNVALVNLIPPALAGLKIPFHVFNPDPFSYTIVITETLVGIDPLWTPMILTAAGDSPPKMIGPGMGLDLLLVFPQVQAEAETAVSDYQFGDASQVEVAVYFDGALAGGITVELETKRLYLPVIRK